MFFLNLANFQRLIALINKDMYIPVEIFTQLSTIVNLVYPKLNFVFFFLDFVIGENLMLLLLRYLSACVVAGLVFVYYIMLFSLLSKFLSLLL